MKEIFSVFIYVALLPSIIQCNNLIDILDAMAESSESDSNNIHGLMKPVKNGVLGKGGFSFTYKGIWLANNQEIAMKFTPGDLHLYAEHEYEIYTWLGAVNDTKIEAYGVPCVYFYSWWNKHVLTAITLLDSEFHKRCEPIQMTEADILIVFRDFVRTSKYIHSKGICHYDMTVDNILFRKGQGFIIDYNLAAMMHGPHGHGIECTKEDFQIFLLSICYLARVEVNADYDDVTIDSISQIQHEGLRKVYLKFTKIAFYGEMPNYNDLFEMINEEIEKCNVPKPALVSWLTPADRIIAERNPTKSIKTIKNPKPMSRFRYPRANLKLFINQLIRNRFPELDLQNNA